MFNQSTAHVIKLTVGNFVKIKIKIGLLELYVSLSNKHKSCLMKKEVIFARYIYLNILRDLGQIWFEVIYIHTNT